MNSNRLQSFALAAAVGLSGLVALPAHAEDTGAPQVFLDKPAKIVAYQLKRLSNAQLLAVERKPTEAKYKPVYEAILTRKGMDRKFRQEAVDALAKLNGSDPVVELLAALGRVDSDDKATPKELVAMLMGRKPEELAKQKEAIHGLLRESDKDLTKQAAYAAEAAADGKPDGVWAWATDNSGLPLLLAGLPTIPDAKLRAAFYDKVKPLVTDGKEPAVQVAAIEAVSAIPGHEAETFKLLGDLVKTGKDEARAAAVRSLQRVPADKWPKDEVEPLAAEVVKVVASLTVDQRTGPAGVQAIALGNDLAAALPPEKGQPIRKSLRELGVQTVLVHTYREQMLFDVRYFVVQAGKPVQVVLENTDTMPHNFVLTAPGALKEVAALGETGSPPSGAPGEKAYVPNSPKVLQATVLVQPDESDTLSFTAPSQPGEYPFLCTFPGHAVRMYGVMAVVPDLDAYEKAPKPPTDPMTKQPLAKPKNDPGDLPPPPTGHEH